MPALSTLAALGMAFGAPLIYADQAWSIARKRNAEGFSKDVCAVLIIANICRIFFWFGERFELALLLQSVLLIAAHLYLLHLLLKYRPGSYASSAYSVGHGDGQAGQNGQRSQQQSSSSQGQASGQSRSTTVTDFNADDENAERGHANTNQQKDASSNPAFTALFGGTNAAKYAPLFGNVNLPAAPTLDDDEEEGSSGQYRRSGGSVLSQLKDFVQGGLRRQEGGTRKDGSSGGRPFGFWTWPNYSSYVIFLGMLTVFLAILQLMLGWSQTYVGFLGFFALGLEATLPIPQAFKNWQRKSLSGLRLTVLIGWTGGDMFKNVYYIVAGSPIQFLICGLFTLVVDLVICAQLYMYREQTARDDDEARTAEAEALEAGQRERAPIEDDGVYPVRNQSAPKANRNGARSSKPTKAQSRQEREEPDESSRFQIEADDEDDDDADLGKARR